ncbi:MAG: hypothetical protein WC777_00250 [Candidatus Gracilibacteria bacterium]|jgi:hypothetical protein
MPISSKAEEGVDYKLGFPEDLSIKELIPLVDSWTEALREALVSLGHNPFTGSREQSPEYPDHFEGRTVLPDGKTISAYLVSHSKFHDAERVARDRLELSITPAREDQYGIFTVSRGERLRLHEVRILLGKPSRPTKWMPSVFLGLIRNRSDYEEETAYLQYARALKQILDLHFQSSLERSEGASTEVTTADITLGLLEASEVGVGEK